MPEALACEFEGVTDAHYAPSAGASGIDPKSGEGDWPPGMLWHVASTDHPPPTLIPLGCGNVHGE